MIELSNVLIMKLFKNKYKNNTKHDILELAYRNYKKFKTLYGIQMYAISFSSQDMTIYQSRLSY